MDNNNNNAAPARSRGVIDPAQGRPANPHPTPNVPVRDLKEKNPTVAKMYAGSAVGGRETGMSLPLTAHHIIPWNVLRAFWNVMMENNLYKSADAYLSIVGVDKSDRSVWLKQAKAGTLPALAFDQMKQDICWAEGNLVWGPSNRVGDPGDEIDNMSAGAGADKDRIAAMARIGERMKSYIASYGTPPPGGQGGAVRVNSQAALDARLRGEINQWEASYAKKKIAPFQLNMWFIETDATRTGGYAPSVGGSAAVHPKWRLNSKGQN